MEFFGHVIDGQEVASIDGATMDDVDPYTREVWATIACGGAEDADRAVAAARRAFDDGPWPRMGYEKRQELLHRLADLMEENADELAMADTRDMGKPIAQARHDVARRGPADHRHLADVLEQGPQPRDDLDTTLDGQRQVLDQIRVSFIAPVLGLPALAVPVGRHGRLRPGVQIMAPSFREDACLAAGEVIEAAEGIVSPIDPVKD